MLHSTTVLKDSPHSTLLYSRKICGRKIASFWKNGTDISVRSFDWEEKPWLTIEYYPGQCYQLEYYDLDISIFLFSILQITLVFLLLSKNWHSEYSLYSWWWSPYLSRFCLCIWHSQWISVLATFNSSPYRSPSEIDFFQQKSCSPVANRVTDQTPCLTIFHIKCLNNILYIIYRNVFHVR